MLTEFKEFINRGNAVELAVAFVMGAAFTPVVTSIVDRVLMPVIGMLFGKPNFDGIGTFGCTSIADAGAVDPAAGVVVGGEQCAGSIGAVVTASINFVLVAVALFFVVKAYNRLQRTKPEQPDEPEAEAVAEDVVLLREIRDALTTR